MQPLHVWYCQSPYIIGRAKKKQDLYCFSGLRVKNPIMLSPLTGTFSIAAVGIQFLSAVRVQAVTVDFVNPNLGGGSMLDNGELIFC